MKCQNCGDEIYETSFYVVGRHTYVCSEKCHKEQVQHLLDTFHPIPHPKEDDHDDQV